MSFVDLATLTMHRRNEMEARLNVFWEKCDRAVDNIQKLKMKTQGYVHQLNCDPSELKERFLSSMKQLEEYMYLITDFNLAISKLDEAENLEHTPVQDSTILMPLPPVAPFNLIDALSEPGPSKSTACRSMPSAPLAPLNLIDALSEPHPSTSTTCQNHCPPEKPKRAKAPKAETLIVFSSSSSSEETVPQAKSTVAVKEVQCELEAELNKVQIEDLPTPPVNEPSNLPAQQVLETDQVYEATIMHVDGAFFWVITDEPEEVQNLMVDMTNFYTKYQKKISKSEVMALSYCAFYDEDSVCYYRGLFIKLCEEDSEVAEIFAVDTGEMSRAPVTCVQPLYSRFCSKPPYARCCHLAGVDLVSYNNKSLMEKQEKFMRGYIGKQGSIEVDDNTSESLGVYVVLPSGETLNKIIIQQGLALPIDKQVEEENHSPGQVSTASNADYEITDCPEYEDPVEAVTGYKNRDEIDICKHYKGGPETTCFKGNRCTKKHILMHPDGWTLDRVPVVGKLKSVPLPAPDTWHKVLVTCICHFDRVYVQLVTEEREDPLPDFGVVLPLTTLSSLVRDMNSSATRCAYKRLTTLPAQGEVVAALYPHDGNWYRARVLSITRADQSVEVIYLDYGTVLWVAEDKLRQLESRHAVLPTQAIHCVLAGVRARSRSSQQWAQAKRALMELAMDKTLDAHVISRDYDEIVIELFDKEGYSIAEQLAANDMVELTEYSVVDDCAVTKKIVAP